MITYNLEHLRISTENHRLEDFISKVLRDEGKSTNVVAENAHQHASEVERLFCADETQPVGKETASKRCRTLLEERLLEEVDRTSPAIGFAGGFLPVNHCFRSCRH
jgi:hypothetical protein